MNKKGFQFCLLFFLLMTSSIISQWKYPNVKNLKSDVIIMYDVVYDQVLSEKQKQYPLFKKEIVVAFNQNKLLEKNFSNNKNFETNSLLDYNEEFYYSLNRSYTTKTAIKSKFKGLIKKTTLLEGEKENILGFDCQVYRTKIKGKFKKIYTTKKLGLRFIKFFNAEGFLLKYSSFDKYLGTYTVTAKKVFYTKLPENTFSLKGYKIKTLEEQKKYLSDKKERSNAVKKKNNERIGELSPKFTVRSIEGKKLKSKGLLGKIIVLNFWFTGCPPCKKEIPQLNKLKEKFKGKDVEFIAIAIDKKYKLDAFLEKTPFTYDLIEDGRWIAEKFDIKLYPTNIIIDQEGKIQFIKTGFKSDITKAISYNIEKLLK